MRTHSKYRAYCRRFKQYYPVIAIEWDTDRIWIMDGSYRDERSFDEVYLDKSVDFPDENDKDVFANDILIYRNKRTNKIVNQCFLRYDDFQWITSTGIPYAKLIKEYFFEVVGNVREHEYPVRFNDDNKPQVYKQTTLF